MSIGEKTPKTLAKDGRRKHNGTNDEKTSKLSRRLIEKKQKILIIRRKNILANAYQKKPKYR